MWSGFKAAPLLPSRTTPCTPLAGFGIQLAVALVTEAAASPQGALIDAAVMASATDVRAGLNRVGGCQCVRCRATCCVRCLHAILCLGVLLCLPTHNLAASHQQSMMVTGWRVRQDPLVGVHRLGLHRAHRR